jgi:hypothetical protein
VGVAQGVGLEFKSQYRKKRERERERVKEVLRDRRYEILVLVLGCGSSEEVEGLPR